MYEQRTQSVDEPDYETLRRHGWAVNLACGRYCVAWRGDEETVFIWGASGWRQVPGRGELRSAA
jgi:hypothetical protein